MTDTGMQCPECASTSSRVVDSRKRQVGANNQTLATWRRRRECLTCETRYTTYELPASVVDDIEEYTKAVQVIQAMTTGIKA